MKLIIDHVILTRFNLPTAGAESVVRAKEGWLRDRQQLFEAYCLPSVRFQDTQNFAWIIYLDTQSPDWLKKRMAELGATGDFHAIYRDSVSPEDLISDIRGVGMGQAEVLITTNLDNDDGLSRSFLRRVQESVVDATRTAIYVPAGLIQQGEKLYLRHDPDNAFCSVSESWNEPKTCWMDWHNRLGKHMQVREVGGQPGWLQVVHAGNVSNRVRGTRVAPKQYRADFVGGLSEIIEPKPKEFIMESFFLVPVRQARDWARGAVKQLALAIGGKEALDKFKASLSMRGGFKRECTKANTSWDESR